MEGRSGVVSTLQVRPSKGASAAASASRKSHDPRSHSLCSHPSRLHQKSGMAPKPVSHSHNGKRAIRGDVGAWMGKRGADARSGGIGHAQFGSCRRLRQSFTESAGIVMHLALRAVVCCGGYIWLSTERRAAPRPENHWVAPRRSLVFLRLALAERRRPGLIRVRPNGIPCVSHCFRQWSSQSGFGSVCWRSLADDVIHGNICGLQGMRSHSWPTSSDLHRQILPLFPG
jgi:hypothetical protein